ncbi:glycoside hydrolase family 76 protein [Sedimentisphaera salicampi]|uniref:Putative glycosyl hydrolase n=1 Tax=Sedimentisphaera salicampi TaxID=1941349 RepID=A0A1W6LJG0_9BACT|nr:glycoside hydrolase family 76 protein [Sedimentisphaera salicampi]ARN55928.1 putative glycosyl hydrolase [Sedimentisphaera salicampi]
MRFKIIHCFLILCLIFAYANSNSAQAPFKKWGFETLNQIDKDLKLEHGLGYYEDSSRDDVSFAWGNAILLLAKAQAFEIDDSYKPEFENQVKILDEYFVVSGGIGGYNCLPVHKNTEVDRYYDDNAWIAMALIDAYEASGDKKFLKKAKRTIDYSLSGVDEDGGGLFWRENWPENAKKSKNTCSVAPTSFSCLKFYQITKQDKYFNEAKELMQWLDKTLKDEEGLYFDHITEDARIGRRKWSYNSAMPVRCYIQLYKITGEKSYLQKAKKTADASIEKWYEDDGGLNCKAMFGFTLVEAWFELSEITGNPKWKNIAFEVMRNVRENVMGPRGRYSDDWDDKNSSPVRRWQLLYPAAAARGYLAAAEYQFAQKKTEKKD